MWDCGVRIRPLSGSLRRRLGLIAWSGPFAVASLLASPPAEASISGICPDGSMYIVQREEQIPCARSKRVEPSEMPPIRPEYMPTPYTWQVWNERHNPNNPYNLIDDARQVRGMDAPHPGQTGGPGGPGAAVSAGPGQAPQGAATAAIGGRAPVAPLDLGLSDQELQDLFLIVELSQERVPARFDRTTADGRGVFQVAMAHSGAFESRLREAWASRGGLGGSRVLLFTAVSKRAEEFFANFTFVQEHLSYQPSADNARQIGILQGRLGSLDANEVVLGYVVLPDTISLAQSLDVYWNDRRTTANFEG
jgi:hypothetical protein